MYVNIHAYNFVFFFFSSRRRHTRYIGDWSSDVCSSDLGNCACHTYGGEGMNSCLQAGVDAPNHLLELDDAGVKILLQKKLPYVVTVDDLVVQEKDDLRDTGGKNSRMRLLEQAFKRALAAGVPIVFGSGVTSAAIPHGKQADQFRYYTKWGMTPVQALQTAYLPAARMLNYGWETQIGSIEKGKYADVIAVS